MEYQDVPTPPALPKDKAVGDIETKWTSLMEADPSLQAETYFNLINDSRSPMLKGN